MTQYYAGVCVGGPYAGRAVAIERPILEVIERGKDTATIYTWLPIGGTGFWALKGAKLETVLDELATAYVEKIDDAIPRARTRRVQT